MSISLDSKYRQELTLMKISKIRVSEIRRIKDDKSAPYVAYHENKASSHLLIYFGSYGGSFAGMTNVESLNCNAIFIRSDKATWYIQEYGDDAKTPMELSEAINNLVATLPHIKTRCMAGFSMGGYGALMMSSWIKSDKVVATAPQTTFPDYPVEGKIPRYPTGFDPELSSIQRTWQKYGAPSCPVIVQSCDKLLEGEHFRDITDATSLKQAFPDKVKLILHSCSGHKGITNALLSNKVEYERLFNPI